MRSTADIVILTFTAMVCAVVVIGAIAVVSINVFRPDVDTDDLLAAITDNVTLVLGAVVGYLAGRNNTTEGNNRALDKP